jgi:hypothetical protein
MADAKDSKETLSIRCPSCRQRFSVGDDLMGRMVECGACDTRFRINDDVILRSKKFYPGERGGANLNHFQRVPLSASAHSGMQPMRYAQFDHPERLEPVSPQRIIAGICGVGLMALIALLFIFAVNPGGAFSVMPIRNKLIIAGFVSLLGMALLVYANPKARLKAGFIGLLLGAGVVSLPFFFTGQPITRDHTVELEPRTSEEAFPPEETDLLTQLRNRFVTRPLEAEQERLRNSASDKHAYGIYLTNLVPRNKYVARDFLIRDTGAALTSHPYPRDEGNYLMVLTEVPMEIEEVANIAARLGKAEEIHPDIGVVVVKVDNTQFLEGSADKLNDNSDPAFYELNLSELRSIDMDRVKRAVERLAAAEPSIYRTDISRTMIELLGIPAVTFHDELAQALLVWAEDPVPAAEVGLEVLRRAVAAGGTIPEHVVELVSGAGLEEAIPTVNEMWAKDPGAWEKYYLRFGQGIIPGLLAQLVSENVILRRSAIRLLGTVGTPDVLPELEKHSGDPDPEVRVLVERAIAKIKGS